jgi:hypothetical protein
MSGTTGNVARWIAFVVLLLSTLAFVGLGTRASKKNRAFHFISAVVAGIATVSFIRSSIFVLLTTFQLSYFALATGSGYVFVYQGLKIVQGKEVVAFRQASLCYHLPRNLPDVT